MTIHNEPIHIRHAEPGDAAGIQDVFAQPKAAAQTLRLPLTPVAFFEKREANLTPGIYPLVATINDRIVGTATLVTNPKQPRRHHVGGLGMAVHDQFHGRGVGSRLMAAIIDLGENWIGLTRIELEVFTDNEPAIALYRKFDFEDEGIKRRFAFRNGVYIDALMMARLKTPVT